MTSRAGTESGPVNDRQAVGAREISGVFARLQAGTRLRVRPAIPRIAEEHDFHVQQIEGDRATIQKLPSDPPLSISAGAVDRVHSPADSAPSLLVLKGRIQWITASERWVLLPEHPPLDSEFGFDKPANPDDPQVIHFVNQLRQKGYSPWWVPKDATHEFLAQGGEVIYDRDGRYFRASDQRSEWILLGKRVAGSFLP